MPQNFILRLCLYYVCLMAVGVLAAIVYTGQPNPAMWAQDVRTAIILVPGGILMFCFFLIGI